MGRLCARRGVCGGRTHRRRRVKKNKSAGPSGPADFLFEGKRFQMAAACALWPYFKEFDFLSGILKSLRAFQNPFFTGRRAGKRRFVSYYIRVRSCSAAHKVRRSLLKKSETLWKCRETKNGRLFIGAKCDTLQIRVSDGCFCKKHLVIKEPRRNGKNDLEQV